MHYLKKSKKIGLTLSLLLAVVKLFAQSEGYGSTTDAHQLDLTVWFGLLELPFLFLCIFYCFKTSAALRGGVFGKGMKYLAWGFVIMAVGHVAMQVHHSFGFDVFRDVFGYLWGSLLWFIALSLTWGLSAIGFYSIYKVSKKD